MVLARRWPGGSPPAHGAPDQPRGFTMTELNARHEAALPDAGAEQMYAGELAISELTARGWDGDGRFRDCDSAQDITHDNTRRAGFALAALSAYADRTGGLAGEPVEQKMVDLLGDLMHLADALWMDFDYLTERAVAQYEPETRGEL
jgi:hypothetical protein